MVQPGLSTSNPQSNYRKKKGGGEAGIIKPYTVFLIFCSGYPATLLNKPPSLQPGFPEQLAV